MRQRLQAESGAQGSNADVASSMSLCGNVYMVEHAMDKALEMHTQALEIRMQVRAGLPKANSEIQVEG
jgi:hypothetical protein